MEQSADEFFHDFRQELLSGAEANGRFQLDEFMETVADELVEIGITEGSSCVTIVLHRAAYGWMDTGSMTKGISIFLLLISISVPN